MRGSAAFAALLAACGFTPLSNQIDVGDEAFVVVVGEGANGATDLFAAPAEGGTFRQLTFTRAAEDLPELGDSGTRLAFVRYPLDTAQPAEVTITNLERGTESAATLPREAGRPRKLGWFAGDDSLAVVAEGGRWVTGTGTPPSWQPVTADRAAAIDSLVAESVGDPGFATIAPCGAGAGVCIRTAGGEESALDRRAIDPIRWGSDAVGYLLGDRIEIRPLGGGRVRRPDYRSIPAHPRRPTHHPGAKR